MGLAIIAPGKDISAWIENLKKNEPELDIQIYPNIERKEDIDAVMLWQHPKGIVSEFANVKLICSMGAGVDHILNDETIAEDLPITRIKDEKLTESMTNYVVMGVLNHHRQIIRYQQNQKNKNWDMTNPEKPVTIGVMGVGELGYDVLEKLSFLNFRVIGFGNSSKENFKYPYFSKTQLNDFLSEVNVLVCMLPLTANTEDALNLELFEKCQKGTYLINVARGKHLVEEDLLVALDKGFICGALLDVFRTEPLPKDHPFWTRDEISITPHIASVTNPEAASPQIIENYRRLKNNQALINQIDRRKGY